MACYASRNSQGISKEGGGSFILNACKGEEGTKIPKVCYISLNMFDVHSFCCCINLHLKTLGIPALSYMYVWFTKGI